jgi:hypothetical protein
MYACFFQKRLTEGLPKSKGKNPEPGKFYARGSKMEDGILSLIEPDLYRVNIK